VSAFEASKFKVTNEQFLEFVLAEGYQTREFWSNEGWEWVQFKQARHPLFWVCPFQCKSGCGSALASYTHCQECHFTNEQLTSFSNGPKQRVHPFIEQLRARRNNGEVLVELDENRNTSQDNTNPLPYK
jgi:hypothetical protein